MLRWVPWKPFTQKSFRERHNYWVHGKRRRKNLNMSEQFHKMTKERPRRWLIALIKNPTGSFHLTRPAHRFFVPCPQPPSPSPPPPPPPPPLPLPPPRHSRKPGYFSHAADTHKNNTSAFLYIRQTLRCLSFHLSISGSLQLCTYLSQGQCASLSSLVYPPYVIAPLSASPRRTWRTLWRHSSSFFSAPAALGPPPLVCFLYREKNRPGQQMRAAQDIFRINFLHLFVSVIRPAGGGEHQDTSGINCRSPFISSL